MNKEDPDQYEKLNPTNSLTQGLPYDFETIMHYGGQDFSIDGIKKYMVRKENPDVANVGDKKILSPLDVQALRIRYNCS